jgi:hypothetical protein
MFKGLRFPEPLKWITLDIFNEIVDGVEDLLILFLPFEILRWIVVTPQFTSLACPIGFRCATAARCEWVWTRRLALSRKAMNSDDQRMALLHEIQAWREAIDAQPPGSPERREFQNKMKRAEWNLQVLGPPQHRRASSSRLSIETARKSSAGPKPATQALPGSVFVARHDMHESDSRGVGRSSALG